MVTLVTLRAAHSEFTDTPDAILTSAIAQAENRHDSTVWGALYDDGVMLLACHIAAATPYGAGGRLAEINERSVYYRDWLELCAMAGSTWRLA